MAATHTILQSQGNQVRSSMSKFDADGTASFLTGTAITLTVATKDVGGTDVDASAAITFTSAAALTPLGLVKAFVDKLNTELDGAHAYYVQNKDDVFVVHIEARYGGWTVTTSSAGITPGT